MVDLCALGHTFPEYQIPFRNLLVVPRHCGSALAFYYRKTFQTYSTATSKYLVESCRGSSSKSLIKRAGHIEEYCVRRSNRVHHKPRCRILCCSFWSFNSQRFGIGASQFIQWPFPHHSQPQ